MQVAGMEAEADLRTRRAGDGAFGLDGPAPGQAPLVLAQRIRRFIFFLGVASRGELADRARDAGLIELSS